MTNTDEYVKGGFYLNTLPGPVWVNAVAGEFVSVGQAVKVDATGRLVPVDGYLTPEQVRENLLTVYSDNYAAQLAEVIKRLAGIGDEPVAEPTKRRCRQCGPRYGAELDSKIDASCWRCGRTDLEAA